MTSSMTSTTSPSTELEPHARADPPGPRPGLPPSTTGELVVDTDSLRRTSFAGYDDFGAYDDFGLFQRDPERASGPKRQRRLDRKRGRVDRRYERRTDRLDRKAERWGLEEEEDEAGLEPMPQGPRRDGTSWGMTAVGGSDTLSTSGPVSIRVRLQHDFRAEDITFTGSLPGATVNSIFFGDRVVWSAPDGIDVSVFDTTGFIRGLLKGQSLGAGLDVVVNGSLPDAGTFSVTLTGKKPVRPGC